MAWLERPRDRCSRAFAKLNIPGYSTDEIDLEGSRQRSEIVDPPPIVFGEFSPFVEKSPLSVMLSILDSTSCLGPTVAYTHVWDSDHFRSERRFLDCRERAQRADVI